MCLDSLLSQMTIPLSLQPSFHLFFMHSGFWREPGKRSRCSSLPCACSGEDISNRSMLTYPTYDYGLHYNDSDGPSPQARGADGPAMKMNLTEQSKEGMPQNHVNKALHSVLQREDRGLWGSTQRESPGGSREEFQTSLVGQRTRVCRPMQRTQVLSLLQEDPIFCIATEPLHHSY